MCRAAKHPFFILLCTIIKLIQSAPGRRQGQRVSRSRAAKSCTKLLLSPKHSPTQYRCGPCPAHAMFTSLQSARTLTAPKQRKQAKWFSCLKCAPSSPHLHAAAPACHEHCSRQANTTMRDEIEVALPVACTLLTPLTLPDACTQACKMQKLHAPMRLTFHPHAAPFTYSQDTWTPEQK